MNKRVFTIALAAWHKESEGKERRRKQYRELIRYSPQILNNTRREAEDLGYNKKRKVPPIAKALGEVAEKVLKVVRQTKARVLQGLTRMPRKIVSE